MTTATENLTPKAEIDGIQFLPIPKVPDVVMTFDGGVKYFDRKNLPYVPKKYTEMAEDLFFNGGKVPLPVSMSPTDVHDAYRWINAALRSFDPSQESKMATVGYALWVWIEGVE